jgi:hypothetical protein
LRPQCNIVSTKRYLCRKPWHLWKR